MRYLALVLFLLLALPAHAQICPDVQCPEGQVRDRTTCLCRPLVCGLVCPPDQKLDARLIARVRPPHMGREPSQCNLIATICTISSSQG